MSKRRRRPSPPPSRSTASPSPPSDDRDWFAISEILDERRRHGRLEYLVDWEGKDTRTGERYDRSWVSCSAFHAPLGPLLTTRPAVDIRERSHPRRQGRVGIEETRSSTRLSPSRRQSSRGGFCGRQVQRPLIPGAAQGSVAPDRRPTSETPATEARRLGPFISHQRHHRLPRPQVPA